jgi:hypothetical protein
MAGLLSLLLVAEDTWWQVAARCYGTTYLIAWCVWYGSIAAMLLQHSFRRSRDIAQYRNSRVMAIAHKAVVSAFLATISLWFCICQFALIAPRDKREFAQELISSAQKRIVGPAYLLFALAGAAGLHAHRKAHGKTPENSLADNH